MLTKETVATLGPCGAGWWCSRGRGLQQLARVRGVAGQSRDLQERLARSPVLWS